MRDVVVVGASAGGVEALAELVRGLPPDLPVAIFVVLHLPPDAKSYLPDILDRAGPLPAVHAQDGARIRAGRVYVAPPNRHLMLEGDRIHLSIGPRIHSLRPSIDVLFRSAARSFGPRVTGVVLSGTLDDGTLGLDAIKQQGGVAIIQDPAEARFSGMPQSAIERVSPDFVVPVAQIPALLARLTVDSSGEHPRVEGSDTVEEGASTLRRFVQAPPDRQDYPGQAEPVGSQARVLREGLPRVIHVENGDRAPASATLAGTDREPMEGGPS